MWQSTVKSTGQASDVDESAVAEQTDLLTYNGWPEGMRLIVRRERPYPGAQLDVFEEADGYRDTMFASNTTVGQLHRLEAHHRAHVWVENPHRVAASHCGSGSYPVDQGREIDIFRNQAAQPLSVEPRMGT